MVAPDINIGMYMIESHHGHGVLIFLFLLVTRAYDVWVESVGPRFCAIVTWAD